MPKIIEDLQQSILNEACAIIENEGLSKLSIRHLSSKLDIAPSTVYNYFKNKNELTGAIVEMRFDLALAIIDSTDFSKMSVEEALTLIIDELRTYAGKFVELHFSMARNREDSTCKADHGIRKTEEFNDKLKARIKRILEDDLKADEKTIDGYAKVCTKLAIMCLHDSEISFREIFETMRGI